MSSIFGECSGNVRSTPTPKLCLRTVNVSRTPWPWRLMTTPSNTWVRRRVPSMTWKWTRRRSPAWNWGTRRSWSRSRLAMTVLMAETARGGGGGGRGPRGRAGERTRTAGRRGPALVAAQAPPGADLGVVTRQQDLGHLPAAVLGRACVVRVLGIAAERRAERLLDRRLLVPQRAGLLAQHRVGDDHGRQLAAGQHVAPDRQRVRAEVLDDALIEALVPATHERDRRLGGQLVDVAVVEHAPARRQRDHTPPPPELDGVDAVERLQRRVHHIDPQHHSGAAAERRVVDLPAAER